MDCFTRFLSLLHPGDTVVVALSGGADSVCLCHRLWTAPNRTFSLLAAHLNHGLRGEESDGDEAFVRTFCQRWGIPLTVKRLAEGELAAQKGLSLEEAGRQCGTTAPPTGWTTGRIPPTAPWITPATVFGSR